MKDCFPLKKILTKDKCTGNSQKYSIDKVLDTVLKKNNIQFNGENYLQIGGTAMGSKVALAYANIFMRDLEEKLLQNHEYKPTVW